MLPAVRMSLCSRLQLANIVAPCMTCFSKFAIQSTCPLSLHNTAPLRPLSVASSNNAASKQAGSERKDREKFNVWEAKKQLIEFRRKKREQRLATSNAEQQPVNDDGVKQPIFIKVSVERKLRDMLQLRSNEKRLRIQLDLDQLSYKYLRSVLESQLPIQALPYKLLLQQVGFDRTNVKQRRCISPITNEGSISVLRGILSKSMQYSPKYEVEISLDDRVELSQYPGELQEVERLAQQSSHYCMVSFYTFTPIAFPDLIVEEYLRDWQPAGILGRTYVAKEGVNAQLAVPCDVLGWLETYVQGRAELRDQAMLNRDPALVPKGEGARPPFEALHVRKKTQILKDGIEQEQELSWSDAGEELSPKDWHAKIKTAAEGDKPGGKEVVIFDCRNSYESDVGKFHGAVPLNTETFRDTWKAIQSELQNRKPESTEVMIYCTGGIRCVKVGAYLKQTMGFKDVKRLRGGIVSYLRDLNETCGGDEKEVEKQSLFKGVNYVFDGRIGQLVTRQVPIDSLPNNTGEPLLKDEDGYIIPVSGPEVQDQYDRCRKIRECISAAFASRFAEPTKTEGGDKNLSSPSPTGEQAAGAGKQGELGIDSARAEAFCAFFSQSLLREADLLQELVEETRKAFPVVHHMCSGPLQGSFLVFLCELTRARRVLEIGCFTGYTTLCFAGSRDVETVISVDRDTKTSQVARRFFDKSKFGHKIELREGDSQAILTSLVEEKQKPFDFVYLDAAKRSYLEQRNFLVEHGLVPVGGLVVADNILWRGRTMDLYDEAVESGERKASETRDDKIANAMLDYVEDGRTGGKFEQVVVPFRDGISIVRRIA